MKNFSNEIFYEIKKKPSKNFLKDFYSNIYFKKNTTSTYSKNYSKEELIYKLNKCKVFLELINQHLTKSKIKNIKGLDVGCGEGLLLKFLIENKFNFVGVDYQSEQLMKFNKKIYRNFIKFDPEDYINMCKINNIKYNFIILNNVLEHVINPRTFFKNIRNILKKNGLILLQVPNDFSDFQKITNKLISVKKNYWLNSPQHLNYFNNNNLEKFIKNNNFKIIDNLSDFPIEFFLFNGIKNYTNNRTSGKNAHLARLKIDNFIFSQGVKNYLNYYRSMYKVGIGRNITLLIKKL